MPRMTLDLRKHMERRNAKIVKLYKNHDMAQIAEIMQMSRQRVGQILRAAGIQTR